MTETEFVTLYETINNIAVARTVTKMRHLQDAEDIVSRSWMTMWRLHKKAEGEGLFWNILKLQARDYVRDDKSRKRVFTPEYTTLYSTHEPSPEEWVLAFEAVREYDPVSHGTRDGYNNHKCRCLSCKVANSDYMKERAISLSSRALV